MKQISPLSSRAYAGLRIGLLGGSFNPAHAGHRDISLYALKRLGLDQVWWLVSPQNPLKSTQGMARLDKRLAEAQRVAHHPRIYVAALERDLGTRFTIDTLKILRLRFPYTRFVWLMGADNMQQISRWRRWETIFKTVPIAVFQRPGYGAGQGRGKAAQRFRNYALRRSEADQLVLLSPPAWVVLDNPLNSLSATQLRRKNYL